MLLEIITPTNTLYSNDVKMVQLPGKMGAFEIFKYHAPIVSSLTKGTLKVIDNKDKTTYFNISEGVVNCISNKIVVLIDSGDEMK